MGMQHDHIERRNGGCYVAQTRVSLDSVVYAFERRSTGGDQQEFPSLRLAQIYGAIAFYLDHQDEVRRYLDVKERAIDAASIPLREANPELWNRLERARQAAPAREP